MCAFKEKENKISLWQYTCKQQTLSPPCTRPISMTRCRPVAYTFPLLQCLHPYKHKHLFHFSLTVDRARTVHAHTKSSSPTNKRPALSEECWTVINWSKDRIRKNEQGAGERWDQKERGEDLINQTLFALSPLPDNSNFLKHYLNSAMYSIWLRQLHR